jgi:anti-sigma regulatory factor (Ser/Thr protein kinase)
MLRLSPERDSPKAARQFVLDVCRQWGFPHAYTVGLLVSEIVTNAVVHAGTATEVMLRRSGSRLRVEITDWNEASPHKATLWPLAESGRGLRIVDRLAVDWGIERHDGGSKTVWFEVDGPPAQNHQQA